MYFVVVDDFNDYGEFVSRRVFVNEDNLVNFDKMFEGRLL